MKQVKAFQTKQTLPSFSTKVGCHLLTESTEAISNESGDLLSDTPTSSPSPLAEIGMLLVGHFSFVAP